MPAGRPKKLTPEVIQKLEEAFLMGCTDLEACLAADIGKSTLYDYCNANPEFSERKEALKQNPVYLAKGIQLKELVDGNSQTAQKVIDRKEGKKVTLEGGDKPFTLESNFTIVPVAGSRSVGS